MTGTALILVPLAPQHRRRHQRHLVTLPGTRDANPYLRLAPLSSQGTRPEEVTTLDTTPAWTGSNLTHWEGWREGGARSRRNPKLEMASGKVGRGCFVSMMCREVGFSGLL